MLKNPIWTAIMQYGATLVTTYWWYYHMHPNVYTFGMQNILVLKIRVSDLALKTNKSIDGQTVVKVEIVI